MKVLFYFIFISIISLNSYGHGENKPGPNGGFILMPGAFHTEVVPNKDNSFHLFLLDLEFKNPTIKDSSVEAVLTQKKNKQVSFNCEVMGGNHYHCKPNKKYSNDSGKLTLKVKRLGATGTAEYDLPLNHNKEIDHSQH